MACVAFQPPPLQCDGRPTYIYALHDPSGVSQRVYVGMTVHPEKRLRQHIEDARMKHRSVRTCWFKSLLVRGVQPEMVILEVAPPGGDYQEAEQFWIASLRSMGIELVNQTDGGHGARGYVASAELRAHLSEIWRAKLASGWRVSDEARARAAAARRGKKLSSAHVEKVAAAHRGRKKGPDYRAKVASARHGMAIRSDNSTGFKGVKLNAGGFVAEIKREAPQKGRYYLGRFSSPIEAAVAYDLAARQRWGAEAALNFPFPGEKGARPGVEPQEWPDLPTVKLREPGSLGRNNHSGFRGVSFDRSSGKWLATIKRKGFKTRSLGLHDSPELASAAYEKAAAEFAGKEGVPSPGA